MREGAASATETARTKRQRAGKRENRRPGETIVASMSGEAIATIAKWVDAGAPEDNPAYMPQARQFADELAWQIGKPDVIVTLPKGLVMKARGPDWWPDITIDPGLTEDRYIRAIQIIPTKGYPNIHHIIDLCINNAID